MKRGISGGCRDGKGTIEGKIIAKGFILLWVVFYDDYISITVYFILFRSFSFKIYS